MIPYGSENGTIRCGSYAAEMYSYLEEGAYCPGTRVEQYLKWVTVDGLRQLGAAADVLNSRRALQPSINPTLDCLCTACLHCTAIAGAGRTTLLTALRTRSAPLTPGSPFIMWVVTCGRLE